MAQNSTLLMHAYGITYAKLPNRIKSDGKAQIVGKKKKITGALPDFNTRVYLRKIHQLIKIYCGTQVRKLKKLTAMADILSNLYLEIITT